MNICFKSYATAETRFVATPGTRTLWRSDAGGIKSADAGSAWLLACAAALALWHLGQLFARWTAAAAPAAARGLRARAGDGGASRSVATQPLPQHQQRQRLLDACSRPISSAADAAPPLRQQRTGIRQRRRSRLWGVAAELATGLLVACLAVALPRGGRAQTYTTQLVPPVNPATLSPEWRLEDSVTYSKDTGSAAPVLVPRLEWQIRWTNAELIDNCTFWVDTTKPFYFFRNTTSPVAAASGMARVNVLIGV